jgi:DNA-binding NarL/FixJ family response regulator
MNALLVDDHPLILSAMQALVQSLEAGVRADTAESSEEMWAYLAAHDDVDILLLDLRLGAEDGFALLDALRGRYPQLAVVIVSASEHPADVDMALQRGAMGFVPKRASNEMLFEALQLVLAGGVYVPPVADGGKTARRAPAPDNLTEASRSARMERAGRPAPAVESPPPGHPPPGSPPSVGSTPPTQPPSTPAYAYVRRGEPFGPVPQMPGAPAPEDELQGMERLLETLPLTPRQIEVLQLLLQGQPNKAIARELGLSVETVKDHVAAVLRVLGVSSRTQAVLAINQRLQRGRRDGEA